MKRLPPSRLGTVTTKSRPGTKRLLTPLRALPQHRLCEDVYPGGFRTTLAGRIYPTPKVIPFPGATQASRIDVKIDHTLRKFHAPVSLCAMLFFAPPVDYFSAFRSLKPETAP